VHGAYFTLDILMCVKYSQSATEDNSNKMLLRQLGHVSSIKITQLSHNSNNKSNLQMTAKILKQIQFICFRIFAVTCRFNLLFEFWLNYVIFIKWNMKCKTTLNWLDWYSIPVLISVFLVSRVWLPWNWFYD